MGRPITLPEALPRACPCGTVFTPCRKKAAQRFCTTKCARRANLKYDDPEAQRERALLRPWTGIGTSGYIRPDGYRAIHVEGRKVLEHRHVMELSLGRRLVPGEVVHHRDGNRSNNEIKNLELVASHSAHVSSHHGKKCPVGCGCRRHDSSTWKRRERIRHDGE